MNDALDISPEVAMGAASTRSEAEAREQRIGEAGQRAFLGTIDTARLLNLARNKARCMWQNENLSEEESDAKLLAFCLELTGDPIKAQFLASAALRS